jgi:ABC-type transporter Mla MlaB component
MTVSSDWVARSLNLVVDIDRRPSRNSSVAASSDDSLSADRSVLERPRREVDVAAADESPGSSGTAGARSTCVILRLGGSMTPADAVALGESLAIQLSGTDVDAVTCEAADTTDADVTTVDAVVRLQLVARRHGCSLSLRRPSRQLLDLLRLAGLTDVVAVDPPLFREPRRQPEQGEETPIHEVVEPGDVSL